MTGVSDFSAKVSRHVSQRLYTSIAPLTEANLYRHTITSPPSQDAKLKHILGYVELQRELIALEEDLYRSVTDKGHWHNTTNNNSYTNNNIELHSSQLAPHNKDTQYPDDETIDQFDLIYSQSLPQQQPAALVHRRSLTSSYHQRKNSSPNPYTSPQQQQRHTPPLPSPALYMQQHHQQLNQSRPAQQQQQSTTGTPAQRHLDNIPDGLDPTMALPRALPRTKMTHHDQTLYRDSFYSGIGQETDWRQLEELDPDSLAGIHLYGDTSDLQPHAASQQQQQQRQQQPSPAAASSPLNKYPTYEFTPDPAPRNSDWQHERHLQQLQQQAILKQLQCPDDENKDDEGEAKVQMATRLHRRQHSIAQAQQLQFEQQHQQHQRQLVSPPPTFIEKEKKAGRFSSRFSFLTRRRQHSQPQPEHQRSDSMPNASKEPWLNDFGNKSGPPDRLNTLGHRHSGNQLVVATAGRGGASPLPLSLSGGPGATTPIEEEQEQAQEEGFPVKNKSRVKQMFRDVFGISKRKCQSPDLAFRDISLPSTHIRSSSTPAHQHQQLYGHPQHLDPSINSQYHYSTAVAQRKGLITPVSRPDTAQSSYRNNNNDNTSNNRNHNNNSNNRSRARESLVDPVQQLGFQKMEFDEDCDLLGGGGAFPEGQNAYGQTSLTPPPASSVLRHSTSPHRSFLSGAAEYEPVLITASAANTMFQQQQPQGGAVVGGRTNRTSGPPSQMTNISPTSKDYVDSGDSTGGLEQPYTTTASNATTLNQHHTANTNTNTTATATIKGGSIYSQQQPQQPCLYSSPVGGGQHQKSPSYDYDQAMTMSTYDNGPTIVSMAQVQKVDLEGLRQSHGHYSLHHHHHQTSPSHSHHLGMVAVESPFA